MSAKAPTRGSSDALRERIGLADALRYDVAFHHESLVRHVARRASTSMSEYRIDYAAPNVDDLMAQVREQASGRAVADPNLPAVDRPDVILRLREHLDLDDARPYQLQRELRLDSGWNVAPEDIYASHAGLAGTMICAIRKLLRPLVKLFVNTDLPLHKQFKVNIGVAAALHDVMLENAALRTEVEALRARLDTLDASR